MRGTMSGTMSGAGIDRTVDPVRILERRGTALVLVLVAIVVLALLSSGAILGTMAELRASTNEQMSQRALTVAEYGVNQQLASWTSTRNSLANGAVDTSTIVPAAGDTAVVTVMRLNARNFWIVSVGRTNRSSGRLEAQRQVNLLVTVSTASKTAPAVLTTMGATAVKGSAYVTGVNTNPTGWSGCASARDTFAIDYNPAKVPSVQKPASQSIGGTRSDPNAANASFFTTFGTETYASLAAKANVSLNGSSPSPTPVGSATTCTASLSNWGEPSRTGSAVVGCQGYFPIIYANSSLAVNGGRGQGVLLVDGDLSVNGNFDFYGLIVVKGNLNKSNGNFNLYGAMMVMGTSDVQGNASLYYSACALSNAFAGQSTPARTKQRAWAQIFQ